MTSATPWPADAHGVCGIERLALLAPLHVTSTKLSTWRSRCAKSAVGAPVTRDADVALAGRIENATEPPSELELRREGSRWLRRFGRPPRTRRATRDMRR